MEFWGVEVAAGKPLKIKPEDGRIIHISQAALGEGKKEKGNDVVLLRLKIGGKMFVVASLSAEKFPQATFDLVFEKEFELSHDWKNGSIYFCGYSAENPFEDDEEGIESSDEDEDSPFPTGITGNGSIEPKVEEPAATKSKAIKPQSSAKPKVTVVEPKKDDKSDEDDEDDDDSDDSDDSDDKDMMDVLEDEDDSDDSEDEDEETPKKEKAGPSKKRATGSASKTPVPAKKAKLDTPQKTDGKKVGGHTATPHPSKKGGKSPAASNSNKSSNDQSPKSEAKVSCKSCSRTFNSDKALESHSKAKHGSSS